ncbi:MAG: S1 RNA-binding domain-containing protein [Pirellulaceae bacterium]
MKLEDLVPGMELTGTVLNVVDFGAFVDIGLSDSGLVHVSRLSDAFINDPHEVVSVGDIITTWVVEVDEKRRRVSLTAIKPGTETQRPERPKREAGSGRPRREKQQTASHDQGRQAEG